MEKPYIITRVSWLTERVGNENRRDEIIKLHFYLAKFLQDNGLVQRKLVNHVRDVDDNFEISSSDLTEEGLEVLRVGLDKWGNKLDSGTPHSDVSVLEKTLTKLRK